MMAIRRCLTSSFRHIYEWRRTILVQTVLIVTLVTATNFMPEQQRVTLQQAINVFRRLKRTTETVFSDSRMAWRSSGRSNEELVQNLERGRLFTSTRVRDAMLAVDRGDFSPRHPYMDQPQGIGWNATISAPHMHLDDRFPSYQWYGIALQKAIKKASASRIENVTHAAALEYLKNHLVDGAYALDVGSGSGYLTVCMALMIGRNGKVVGIEHIPELVALAKKNTEKHHADLLSSGRVLYVEGDGRRGYELEDGHKYDAIHVGAAAETIPPALIEQLANGGRMLIPVGKEHGNQVFLQVDKNEDGEVTQKVIEHVIYVPLTSKNHQLGRD